MVLVLLMLYNKIIHIVMIQLNFIFHHKIQDLKEAAVLSLVSAVVTLSINLQIR